jgi:hypothetical protein
MADLELALRLVVDDGEQAQSRISLGLRYWPMKLSSLKLRIAWSSVGSQGAPAMSGNQARSSSVGASQMRLMSVYIAKPSA